MNKNVSVFDDINTDKIDDWDFEKNINVDVLEESFDSEKEVQWICSNCGKEYSGKIAYHSQLQCPECGYKQYSEFTGYKKKFICRQIISYLCMAIASFLLTFLQYCVTFKWEIITRDLILTLLFSTVILFEVISICVIIQNIKLNKDSRLIKTRYTLFNILKNCKEINVLKNFYYTTIECRLLSLITNTNDINSKNMLDVLRYNKIKSFDKIWVEKEHRSEFKSLLSIYKNENYFYKLYSKFETKQLINFSSETNIKLLGLSILITIISLFLSVYPIMNNWDIFLRKFLVLIVVSLFIIILMVFDYKRQKRYLLNNYKFDIIYVSSAIAKINNLLYEDVMEHDKNGRRISK